MKRSRTIPKIRIALDLALGLVLVGLSACSQQGGQSQLIRVPAEPAAQSKNNKDIWVSETTGKEYRVTVGKDVLHIEWANVPADLAGHGTFIRSECKLQGPKWVGTSSSYLPCTLGKGEKPNFDNWCHLETKIEIDSMTPDRITGQGEGLEKFDCMKCKILQSSMKDFLWRPK